MIDPSSQITSDRQKSVDIPPKTKGLVDIEAAQQETRRKADITTQQVRFALHEQQTKAIANRIVNLEVDRSQVAKEMSGKKQQPRKRLELAKSTNQEFVGADKKV